MSLELFAQIGESAGILAVLITLLYLSVQLRQHSREIRDQTAWRITESLQDFAGMLVEPTTAELWCAGNDDFESLSRVDRERYIVLVALWHNILMALYRTKDTSAIPSEYWEQAVGTFAVYHSQYPGFRRALEFVTVPDDLMAEIRRHGARPALRPTSAQLTPDEGAS